MKWPANKYCNDIFNYSRIKTTEVMVGNVGIGGNNPIRIQSMTTTNTKDTIASVAQSITLIDSGAELVRLTAPSIKDAKNLYDIKNALIKRGYNTPLIADIHFTPNAAIEASKYVDKVRINPGNYIDKKKFQTLTFSKAQYREELKRIEEKLVPLIESCKIHNTAMRIGTNHGSLSDRILSYFGDTPIGMVESALEFVRICEKFNYKKIILSMKASNTIIMAQAYRLLVNRMRRENMFYPLHLGVTEAGEGDDGRIKSAVGIGSLLMDGIGDTIRVSLTESPEKEMPVAKKISNYIENKKNDTFYKFNCVNWTNPYEYTKNISKNISNIGGDSVPVVVSNMSNFKEITTDSFESVGYRYSNLLDKWTISDSACDYIFLGDNDIEFEVPGTLGLIYNFKKWEEKKSGFPLFCKSQYLKFSSKIDAFKFLEIKDKELDLKLVEKLKLDNKCVLIITSSEINCVSYFRRTIEFLLQNKIDSPIILCKNYIGLSKSSLQIESSIDFGSLLLDGFGDGIFIVNNEHERSFLNKLSFDILQATRTRISKTEYISCPSCGRTLFDLEETTSRVRAATGHLKGLKIGVMGCIVNGPGEMADADYGYVGVGPGKISLYKKQEVVKKNIPTLNAIEELIDLIRENGDWIDQS